MYFQIKRDNQRLCKIRNKNRNTEISYSTGRGSGETKKKTVNKWNRKFSVSKKKENITNKK